MPGEYRKLGERHLVHLFWSLPRQPYVTNACSSQAAQVSTVMSPDHSPAASWCLNSFNWYKAFHPTIQKFENSSLVYYRRVCCPVGRCVCPLYRLGALLVQRLCLFPFSVSPPKKSLVQGQFSTTFCWLEWKWINADTSVRGSIATKMKSHKNRSMGECKTGHSRVLNSHLNSSIFRLWNRRWIP